MIKMHVRQLDSKSEIYAAIDDRGSIIATGTKEVCEFLILLANQELRPTIKGNALPRTNKATIRSAIEI